jgi:predicted anti-sigma-YlaC factor YlaD
MGCEIWHGSIAVHILSGMSTDDEAQLLAHLESCDDCRVVASELEEICKLLGYVNREADTSTTSIPAQLAVSATAEQRHENMRICRRRWL